LRDTAHEIDATPEVDHSVAVATVRCAAERSCRETVDSARACSDLASGEAAIGSPLSWLTFRCTSASTTASGTTPSWRRCCSPAGGMSMSDQLTLFFVLVLVAVVRRIDMWGVYEVPRRGTPCVLALRSSGPGTTVER
jgi:hypothetical protein